MVGRRAIALALIVALAACAEMGREPAGPHKLPPATESFLVFFGFDSAELDGAAQEVVRRTAAKSGDFQPTRIQVSGYADVTGRAAYNRALAERRARAVEVALVSDGVARALINVTAVGEEALLRDRAAERRVEILLIRE
jgi:outer membrane protein OmpA-like peptidoglycan-associated protein